LLEGFIGGEKAIKANAVSFMGSFVIKHPIKGSRSNPKLWRTESS
jgi:hypothetical protein